MASITSVATAVPPYIVNQATVHELARRHFATRLPHVERYMPVFANAQVDTRALAAPPQWFLEPKTFQQCNDLFIDVATTLGEQAAQAALAAANLAPTDIDHILWVCTTGIAAPSPEVQIMQRLGMRSTTRRTPIWGLGCAGGVAGLARAADYVRAYPQHRALLLSVELCSLTFQWNDFSPKNLVAAALFADGAAAVVVEGAGVERGRLAIIATRSITWPDTQDVMGWQIVDSGMRVVFGTRIPRLVREVMHEQVLDLIAPHGLTLEDIAHWVLHPGGAKVISAYQAALGVAPEALDHTRAVLRQYGNMSSGTVFFVLERFVRERAFAPGEYGVLAVLGPGFSCELALVQQL